MIEAKGLSRTYTTGEVSTYALRDTNLSINKGEFIAITGHSGAGKSTLLYQLGLLDAPSTGTVFLDGIDTSVLSHKKRTQFRLTKLGYIFQNYSLMPELNAVDNVRLLLLMQGVSARDASYKAREVLDRVGLSSRTEHFPSQLSGGEQQRVSIARAIAHDPIIIFADEPTANLDSKTSQVVIDYLKELNEGGQTIVMVTHEQRFSKQAKRLITMEDGYIIDDLHTTIDGDEYN